MDPQTYSVAQQAQLATFVNTLISSVWQGTTNEAGSVGGGSAADQGASCGSTNEDVTEASPTDQTAAEVPTSGDPGDGSGDKGGNNGNVTTQNTQSNGPSLWELITSIQSPMFLAIPSIPDMVALSVPVAAVGLDGYSGSIVNIGFIGTSFGVWATGGVTYGSPDASIGVGLVVGYYHGNGTPSFDNAMGFGSSHSFGLSGGSFDYSTGYDSYGGKPIWDSYQLNVQITTREVTPLMGSYQYTPTTYTIGKKF